MRFIPTSWQPAWSTSDNWTSLHELLFVGTVNEVSGRPRSLFSNRLVVEDQSFVDPDKLNKVTITYSFSGRDLREAVLNRSDLRKVDFSGALLNDASFVGANLQDALFGCRFTGIQPVKGLKTVNPQTGLQLTDSEPQSVEHLWPDDGCARLQGAVLDGAQLQGAVFNNVQLQGASFAEAKLQGAQFKQAELQAATLRNSRLRAADLSSAQLQGACLSGAQLQGASLDFAGLQGANLDGALLQDAGLRSARVWRALGTNPTLELADLNGSDLLTEPWNEPGGAHSYAAWLDQILKDLPPSMRDEVERQLSVLGPSPRSKPCTSPEKRYDYISTGMWQKASLAQSRKPDSQFAVRLGDLGCLSDSAPHVARGLLTNGRAQSAGSQVKMISDRFHGQSSCPGIKGFTDEDWVLIDELVSGSSLARQ
jgi:uncharacterized protein YjbI with pentapeptide repeats